MQEITFVLPISFIVSLTQLLHMYATPGNSSKLELETCNVGRHCGRHKFYYIYSRRGDMIIGILIWFGSTSVWRLELHYKLVTDVLLVRRRLYILIILKQLYRMVLCLATLLLIQGESVWLYLLNLIERQVLKPFFIKGKTIIQLSQILSFTINIELF